MRDILIQCPLKVLRLELNAIRLVYANDLKGISKMEKDDIINLLIKYNYDVSNLSAPQLRAKKKTATEKKLIDASKIIAEIPKAEMNASVSITKAIKQKLARKNLIKEQKKTMFFEENDRKQQFLSDAVKLHPKYKMINRNLNDLVNEYNTIEKYPLVNKRKKLSIINDKIEKEKTFRKVFEIIRRNYER